MEVEERNPVEVLAEDYGSRIRRGENPSIDEYKSKHPTLADEIDAVFPSVAMMEELKRRKHSDKPCFGTQKLDTLGDFKIIRELGRGGMGIVYEAHEKTLDRRVALKVLPRHSLLDHTRLQRFQREARAAAQLHHTNIVPVFGVGQHDGLHYYFMQYIEGQALNETVERLRGVLQSPERAAEILPDNVPRPPGNDGAKNSEYWRWVAQTGVQVAEALQYAHKQGITHRDIKPANIIVDPKNTAWITDFGLAKSTSHDNLTQTGELVGTLQYLAPESFNGQGDSRSDIYSLGLTIYEMLTLQPPYSESTAAQLIKKVADHEPVRPRKIDPRIPVDLETIVLKASARTVAQRYQTGAEFADDLRRFLDDRPIMATQIGPVQRFTRWCRRNRAIASLSAAACLSLILAMAAGWIGYVKTRDALKAESDRSGELATAKQQAEENVQLSLQAFEAMFNQLELGDPGLANGSLPPAGAPQPRGPGPGQGPGPGRDRDRPPPPMGRRPDGPDGPEGPEGGGRRPEDDAALLKSILQFYERFATKNATNTSVQYEAAKAYAHVGDIQQRFNDNASSESAYRRGLAISDSLLAKFPDDFEYRTLAAQLHGRVGLIDQRSDKLADAEKHFNTALETHLALAQQLPSEERNAIYLAHARGNLANLFSRQQKLADARKLLEAATNDLQLVVHKSPRFRGLMAAQLRALSHIVNRLGDASASRELLNRAEKFAPPQNGPRQGGPRGGDNRPPPPPPHERY